MIDRHGSPPKRMGEKEVHAGKAQRRALGSLCKLRPGGIFRI
jgi:hypothetical protein